MNLNFDKEMIIYRYDGQYGSSYSIKLTKKNLKGEFETAFMPVRFKKGIELENKTKINIKNAWITFNLVDKKPSWYVFINEFEKVEETKEEVKEEKVDYYQEFAEETNDLELPF